MEFDVSAAEEYLLIHCYSVGYHCAPVTVEVLLCTSTAIEVTKLWQNITPVASKPPTSPPKVIPELCCCFFTRALSARCSPLVACCLSQLGGAQIVIGCHRLQRAQDNKGMPTLATAASAPRMQCLCRLTLCSVGRCCLWQTGGG